MAVQVGCGQPLFVDCLEPELGMVAGSFASGRFVAGFEGSAALFAVKRYFETKSLYLSMVKLAGAGLFCRVGGAFV